MWIFGGGWAQFQAGEEQMQRPWGRVFLKNRRTQQLKAAGKLTETSYW